MLIALWIHKATNTYSEYVILLAFPVQILLNESTSVLRYRYIACLFIFIFFKLHDLNLRKARRVSVNLVTTGIPRPSLFCEAQIWVWAA